MRCGVPHPSFAYFAKEGGDFDLRGPRTVEVKVPTLSQITLWRSKEDPMCPACIANAALMAGSVMSTGGIAALAVKLVRPKKSGPDHNSQNATERSNEHGNDDK